MALIGRRIQELVDQVTVGGMQLDPIEARLDRQFG